MKIQEITGFLESIAPLDLQEKYDNAGLLIGQANQECTGVLIALDAIEEVIEEAVEKKCNLVVAHHPILFTGLKKINGDNYVEKTIIRAIKNDIAIYAIHTNLDNVLKGVNDRMADRLGLTDRKVLAAREGLLKKLVVFVPQSYADSVRTALFAAGAGDIGNYSECSFSTSGTGTFKGNVDSKPFIGIRGKRQNEPEIKIEVIFPDCLKTNILNSMFSVHPYEEVAHDILSLDNLHPQAGAGLIGDLKTVLAGPEFLKLLKEAFGLTLIRHTKLLDKPVKKIALCGGMGSFLTGVALAAGADFFVTSDFRYHQFFDAENRLVIADIGHFESEQFTIELLYEALSKKFPTFAVQKTGVNTNPVKYFI